MTAARNFQPANTDLPPLHNIQAEQALLGAILASNDVWHRIGDWLKPAHFNDSVHGRIYDACGKLITRNMVANPVTLKNLFDQDQALSDIGGAGYLVNLQQSVISIRDADDFARVVLDLSQRRMMVNTLREAMRDAQIADPDRTALDIIESTEAQLATIADATGGVGTVSTSAQASMTALEAIEKAMQVGYGGLSTGFPALDRRIGGLHRSDLIIVAGRPNMGKSDLAVAFVDNVAHASRAARMLDPQAPGGAVFFASLEMSEDQISMRQMARRTQLSTHAMRTGHLSPEQFARVADAQRDIATLPLVIDKKAGATPANIMSGARRAMRQHGGLQLIVVDYLGLMNPTNKAYAGQKVQEVSEITKALKNMARELDVPVVALSQLNRGVENRDDKRPQLADLRDSGAIEQDADVVIFVYRDEYYLSKGEPKRNQREKDGEFHDRYEQWKRDLEGARDKAELIIGKQRHGPTGTVKVAYHGKYSTFGNLQDDGTES